MYLICVCRNLDDLPVKLVAHRSDALAYAAMIANDEGRRANAAKAAMNALGVDESGDINIKVMTFNGDGKPIRSKIVDFPATSALPIKGTQ